MIKRGQKHTQSLARQIILLPKCFYVVDTRSYVIGGVLVSFCTKCLWDNLHFWQILQRKHNIRSVLLIEKRFQSLRKSCFLSENRQSKDRFSVLHFFKI